MTNQGVTFKPEHRPLLEELLKSDAEGRCRQLCTALDLPYSPGGGTLTADLYFAVIEKILENGVSKQELIAALNAVGHKNLAEDLNKEPNIQDDKKGDIIKGLIDSVSRQMGVGGPQPPLQNTQTLPLPIIKKRRVKERERGVGTYI